MLSSMVDDLSTERQQSGQEQSVPSASVRGFTQHSVREANRSIPQSSGQARHSRLPVKHEQCGLLAHGSWCRRHCQVLHAGLRGALIATLHMLSSACMKRLRQAHHCFRSSLRAQQYARQCLSTVCQFGRLCRLDLAPPQAQCFAQGTVELSDEGARLLAEGCRPLQGPEGDHMNPGQCTVVNVDILARFWLVRSVLSWSPFLRQIYATPRDALQGPHVSTIQPRGRLPADVCAQCCFPADHRGAL